MVLVVGGAGYIGSHVVQALMAAGESLIVFDNLEQGHASAVCGSPLIVGDLRDRKQIHSVFEAHPEIELVMHFAGYSSVGESVRQPEKYRENNVSGSLNLFHAMGDRPLVFSSTAAIFGEPEYLPIDENHPTRPTSPYGETKLMIERALDSLPVRSVCLRYFNAAGADPEGRIGERHDPETHLIPLAILAALGKTDPLLQFGNDYATPDGSCVRDYVHVCDLAAAHLSAMDHLRAKGESRKYNLGNGNGYSVLQVIDSVERIGGRPVPRRLAPRREGDPARLVASSESIRCDWGWSPKYPDLDSMVLHAWNWFSGK